MRELPCSLVAVEDKSDLQKIFLRQLIAVSSGPDLIYCLPKLRLAIRFVFGILEFEYHPAIFILKNDIASSRCALNLGPHRLIGADEKGVKHPLHSLFGDVAVILVTDGVHKTVEISDYLVGR